MTYLLDGGTHNDPFNNLNLPLPFPDALQEFKVETSALPAQYGHHSAAAVNAVTKAGTNNLHGDLFEFLRNGSLNARNAFASSHDTLRRNQFGGTIGGPVVKNKVFFFGGFQGTISKSDPSTVISYTPTAQMLAGDFTAITSPACNTAGRQINLPAPFLNNRISPSLLSAPAVKLVSYLPATEDPCGKTLFVRNTESNERQTLGRVDYQLSGKHSVFGRYFESRLNQPTDYDGKNPLTMSNGTLIFRVYSLVLGDTYLIDNGTVSNFRGTLNRSKIPKLTPTLFDFNDLGIKGWVYTPKYMSLSVTGAFAVGGVGGTEGHYNTTSFQFSEDLSLVRGAHQFGLGANWIHSEMNRLSSSNTVGPFVFNGQVSGLALADFLIGKPSQFQQSNVSLFYPRSHYVGLYFQDAWKASSRLTVNAGVRWDPYLGVYSKHGIATHFDAKSFAQGVRSLQYTNAPAGLILPGDPGYPGNKMITARLTNFAPRLGIAWDPKGDGRMSIRAAYGIFFDLPHLQYYVGMPGSAPFASLVTLPFPPGLEDPWQSYPGGNPFPLSIHRDIRFPSFGSYTTHPFDAPNTYSNQWNLSVQRQLGTDLLVSANYVGNNIVHLWTGNQINPAVYAPGATTGNINQRRVLNLQNPDQGRYYGSVQALDPSGTATYDGLLVSVQRRHVRGLTLQGNYTWSHCISDLLNTELGVAGSTYMIPNNRRSSRSNCPTADRRHIFSMSSVYEMPQFSDKTLRVIASNWQVSGIVRILTGSYLTMTTGVDSALSGQPNQRPNQVLLDPYAAVRTVDRWMNPAAFQQPAAGAYGNVAAGNILGPGSIRIDMGLTRTFRLHENQTLQFRAEAFNLPNHVNPGNPVTALNDPNFGRIQSAADPRILQLALKYVF
ncbi:MAG: TonB-dependent receptor [Acidobacteria bacterium]|nr:MAG: TonB-dependent receptor [Acidobacteriota bacterium]